MKIVERKRHLVEFSVYPTWKLVGKVFNFLEKVKSKQTLDCLMPNYEIIMEYR